MLARKLMNNIVVITLSYIVEPRISRVTHNKTTARFHLHFVVATIRRSYIRPKANLLHFWSQFIHTPTHTQACHFVVEFVRFLFCLNITYKLFIP